MATAPLHGYAHVLRGQGLRTDGGGADVVGGQRNLLGVKAPGAGVGGVGKLAGVNTHVGVLHDQRTFDI